MYKRTISQLYYVTLNYWAGYMSGSSLGALSVIFTATLKSITSPFCKALKLVFTEGMCSKSHTWKATKPNVGPRPTLPNSKLCTHPLIHKDSGEVTRMWALARAMRRSTVLCPMQIQGMRLSSVFSSIKLH